MRAELLLISKTIRDHSIDSSSIDPLPEDTHNIDLPMALCKDKHSCTEHPIQ